MLTAIAFAVVLASILLHLVLHEAAHAYALRSLGGNIRAAGLGLPFPPTARWKPRGHRRFELTLSPWLLGAYVEADEESERMLPSRSYLDQAWFAGAGVIANFVTGLAMLVVSFTLAGRWLAVLACTAAGVLLWLFRRAAAGFLVPLLGVGTLVLVAVTLPRAFAEQESAGVAGVFADAPPLDAASILAFSASVALALGLVNCIPLFPLDGGRVVHAALDSRLSPRMVRRVQTVGMVAVVVIVVASFASDVLWAVA